MLFLFFRFCQYAPSLKMQVRDDEPDFGLPHHQVGIFTNDDSSIDGMVFYEHDRDSILKEIHDYYTQWLDGEEKVRLLVQYLGEDANAWVDYNEFYEMHPEAVIDFYRRTPELMEDYPNGVVGSEALNAPLLTVVGPLSPLPEEEVARRNNELKDNANRTHNTNSANANTKHTDNTAGGDNAAVISNNDRNQSQRWRREYKPHRQLRDH
jgi:hypothetical protein